MTPIAVLLLAAVPFASSVHSALPSPQVSYTYQPGSDPDLPPLPAGFVRTLSSFAFSPDEKWIAVIVGGHATDPHNAGKVIENTLVLVPFPAPASQTVHIDPGMPVRSAPFWSPDSQTVAVQGTRRTEAGALGYAGIPKVYNLHGQQLWTRPEAGAILGFLAPDRLLAYHLTKKEKLAGFDTVDICTGAVTPWIAKPQGRLAALDAASHRVAVFSDALESKTLILDYPSGRILRSLKNQTWVDTYYSGGFPSEYFAENGKTLCSVERIGWFKSHPACSDVDTGKPVAEFQRFQGGPPAAASASGSRMVLSDLNYLPDPSGGYSFRGRVVWDFRTDSEVAAWGPSTPQVAWFATPAAGVPITPVTISATGRYVAERFASELRIYEIP